MVHAISECGGIHQPLAPGIMHCTLRWTLEAVAAARKGHFRVRHFAGVFEIAL